MHATRDGMSIEDLKVDEIELLEDGVVQTITAFEHVKVAPAGPQDSRREPTSVDQSREMAAEGRARVFVIFLDTYHTSLLGSANMRVPLVKFLDRLLGADDMVGLVTPEMAASDLTLARKTTVISNIMQEEWWGRRGRGGIDLDPKEQLYEACFGTIGGPNGAIAQEMRDRRREKLTLDAVEDLITHLNGIREERKAVLAVTEGWLLYEPNSSLARKLDQARQAQPGDVLGRPPRPRPSDANTISGTTMIECEADRVTLANLNHSLRLRELTDQANRGNVTFYPIFAKGLTAFDSDIGPERPPSPIVDASNLRTRQDTMRQLADLTDGTAVINTNDLTGAMKRIADDLSSYYLLGYYSTNTKLDGRFRSIDVRVKRPGARVRARRGYRGLTPGEVLTRTGGGNGGDPAVTSALSVVAGVNTRAQFRIHTAAWSRPDGGAFWLVGELDFRTRRELAWTAGADAELTVVGADGRPVASTTVKVPANEGVFTLHVPDSGNLDAGEYAVRVRLRPTGDGDLALSDLARVIVGTPSPIGEALLWRRGPTTGPVYLRTADPRFSRNDRLRLDLATMSASPATARLLDRVGQPLQVPVQVALRPDASGGFTWLVADLTLAPLTAGDYAIEVTQGDAKQITGFRIVP